MNDVENRFKNLRGPETFTNKAHKNYKFASFLGVLVSQFVTRI